MECSHWFPTFIGVDERSTLAWLQRRAGFGVAPGELDAMVAAGVDATIERMVDPDGAGVAAVRDPWQGLTFQAKGLAPQAVEAIGRWVDTMGNTPRPFEDWMVWFWHGHFATAIEKVKSPQYMIGQLQTMRRLGLRTFPELLKALTIDAAMLVWLDGLESTGTAPNENYGREVLELFALGIGNYTEADVQAGAKALTGWTVAKRAMPRAGGLAAQASTPRFLPYRHDATPQTYLGHDGVHDVDTVVAAICAQPACARFVAGKLAHAVIGQVDDSLVDGLARQFSASGLDLRVLSRAVLHAAVDQSRSGRAQPVVAGPVPWLAGAMRATGTRLTHLQAVGLLRAAGQLPMDPPSVGGWPSGPAWLGTSTATARYQTAGLVASATAATHPARTAAARGDMAGLANALGRPEGFSAPTIAGVRAAQGAGGSAGVAALTVALVSPDLVLA